jgi:signal transduction histidine kinase
VAGAFAVLIMALFGFIYWKTDAYLVARSDRMITTQINVIATLPAERRLNAIKELLEQDSRGVQYTGLFGSDGRRIAGNLEAPPPGLMTDATVQGVKAEKVNQSEYKDSIIRAIARGLPGGDILVVGRRVDEAMQIAGIVGQALLFGLLPAFVLCLMAGALLSIRAQRRVEEVNERVQRIIAGDLRERLPNQKVDDPFSKLAGIVNGMLDEMETLIHALAGVGNDIAHDLRTPLTRARLTLERGRNNATTLEQLQGVADKAIAGIDQTLTIVTALLRLAEIENTRRSAGFGMVDLAQLVREVGELYEPIAENKSIVLCTQAVQELTVRGDRDLLIEAIANLVDNAVKFTPEGGRIEIALNRDKEKRECVVSVKDTGPGICEDECEAVMRRFYRSDKIRNTPGVGLGMNLVAAIVRLHSFRFSIVPGGLGCVVEIACPDIP